MVAAAFSIALGFGIVAPVIPQFAKSFEVTNSAASFVVSAFALMRMVFAPASGWLTRRFGERTMFMIGIMLVSASSFASAFSSDYLHLLVFRSLGGIGSVTFSVAAMSLIFRLAPEGARGRASAAYGSGFLLGNIIGPVFGALVAPFGYRVPFVIYAAFLACSALIVKFYIPKHVNFPQFPLSSEDGESGHNSGTSATQSAEITMREAMQVPRFNMVLVTNFAQGWTNLGIRNSIVPLMVVSIVAAPVWLAGSLLAAFAIGNGLALLTSGRWSDLYGRRRLIIVGLVISGAFTLPMGSVHEAWMLIVMSLLAGYGTGLLQPSQQGVVADVVGSRSGGTVVSVFQQSGDLGQILGPIVAGVLADHFGFEAAFISAGVLILVCVIPWLWLDHDK